MRRLLVVLFALAAVLAANTAPASADYYLAPNTYRDVHFDGCWVRVMYGTYGDGYAIMGEYVGPPTNSICGASTGVKVFTALNGTANRSVLCANYGRYPPYNVFPWQCVYTPPATTMAHVPGTAYGLEVHLCNANNSQCADAALNPWGTQ